MWLALILNNSGNHNSNDRLSFTNHKLVDFCSRFLFTEYEMKSDDDWLMNSDNEPGSPITMDDIFKKCERKFKFEDINCKDYHKEERRILYAKMDTKHKLSGAHFHSFCRRYERQGGMESKCTTPDYDAWCLVRGKCRKAFDSTKFFKKYSDVRHQLTYLRDIINIGVTENFYK